MLKSSDVVWFNTEVPLLLKQDLSTMGQDQLILLVKELDRRFMQMWDKVAFERDRQLVDYSKLGK